MILKVAMLAGIATTLVACTNTNQTRLPETPPTAEIATSPQNYYKVLFNHEAAIFCTFMKDRSPEDTGPEFLASFIAKLEDTDVDAVMFCPTAWRANVFPSEVDPKWKEYQKGQVSEKWRGFDYIMEYIHAGGDPVAETLAACRKYGKAFFISYRMNDAHWITDVDWPTHTSFWRNHPEYWLGDSDISATFKPDQDNVRLHNYMIPAVRDWYFAILEELCTRYDVDGLELDFQRAPRFFYNHEIEAGREVMTGFVERIRKLLDQIGEQRGKHLKLCVRVPETLDKCLRAGLDVAAWDRKGIVDMVNVSNYYLHSLDLDLEGFRQEIAGARIYAEMLAHSNVSPWIRGVPYNERLRYTTLEMYRASALNFLSRGADGLSFFNYDYVPHGSPQFHQRRLQRAQGLKNITNLDFLRSAPKNYVIVPYRESRLMAEFYTPVSNAVEVDVVITDDTSQGIFAKALLRVETTDDAADLQLTAWLNGNQLLPSEHENTEMFAPVLQNSHGYPTADKVRFYAVPLDQIVTGSNRLEIHNLDAGRVSIGIVSLELGLFH